MMYRVPHNTRLACDLIFLFFFYRSQHFCVFHIKVPTGTAKTDIRPKLLLTEKQHEKCLCLAEVISSVVLVSLQKRRLTHTCTFTRVRARNTHTHTHTHTPTHTHTHTHTNLLNSSKIAQLFFLLICLRIRIEITRSHIAYHDIGHTIKKCSNC